MNLKVASGMKKNAARLTIHITKKTATELYCDDLQVPDGVCKYCGEEIIEQYDWEEFWGQRVKRWYKDCGC